MYYITTHRSAHKTCIKHHLLNLLAHYIHNTQANRQKKFKITGLTAVIADFYWKIGRPQAAVATRRLSVQFGRLIGEIGRILRLFGRIEETANGRERTRTGRERMGEKMSVEAATMRIKPV